MNNKHDRAGHCAGRSNPMTEKTEDLITEARRVEANIDLAGSFQSAAMIRRLADRLAALTTPQEAKSAAKVVPVSYEASASCSHGVCPAGCSHLMWSCSSCSCEGGWGASREQLGEIAAKHECPSAPQKGGWSTQDRREAESEAESRWPIRGAETFDTERDQIIFRQGCINGFILGAEWWKARTPTPQAVIDEHMRKVAHRVMDAFENADDEALADDIMADVFAAVGIVEAFTEPLPVGGENDGG